MSDQPKTRMHGTAAARALIALMCAMLVVTGLLHDTQHAASDTIESCAACPQLGHAVPTKLVKLDLLVNHDETGAAQPTAPNVPARRPFSPRLSRAPPLA